MPIKNKQPGNWIGFLKIQHKLKMTLSNMLLHEAFIKHAGNTGYQIKHRITHKFILIKLLEISYRSSIFAARYLQSFVSPQLFLCFKEKSDNILRLKITSGSWREQAASCLCMAGRWIPSVIFRSLKLRGILVKSVLHWGMVMDNIDS